ncbi:MAG: hypothetical protein IT374_13375 [Polyangiaceae bacterium]|nr:hypothetical protein [Polyangiaceae bacterium]
MKKPAPPTSPPPPSASWWDESCLSRPDLARRDLLKGLLGASAGAATAAGLYAGTQIAVTRDALEVQRELGWSFGAAREPLVFDGETEAPFDRAALATLVASLRPTSPAHRPFYVPTLLEAPTAPPPIAHDDGAPTLAEQLLPLCTGKMAAAYRRGEAQATRLADARSTLVIVDLLGPESVAFAAGMARGFDVVLGFDNWPHPRGVVASHLTLAAAVYYQPRFLRAAADRPADAPAVLALDRARLGPRGDKSSRFDNRYLASVPTVEALRELGVTRVVYVVPGDDTTLELDDLNADFVAWAAAGVEVRRQPADALDAPESTDVTHAPVARETIFSRSDGATERPEGFGAVAVLVAASTGQAQGLLFGMSQLGCCAGGDDDDGWGRGSSTGG